MCKESFEERINNAKKEAALEKSQMSEDEIKELKQASRRHSAKVKSEIETSEALENLNKEKI